MKKLFSIFAAVLFAGSMMAADWAEIKFTAATAAGVFNDSVFEAGDFKLTCVDTDNSKLKTTANNCVFGTSEEDKVQYEFRLQTSGKSSAKNALNLTIPADGQLRIAVRTGSSSDETRTLILTQGETELYNQVVKDADTIVGITNPKIFKFITVDVKAGEVAVAYPINAVNFYSFAFKAADEPAETGCAWDELAWIGDGSPEQIFGSQFKVCVGDPAPNVVNIQKPGFAAESGIYMTFAADPFNSVSLEENQYAVQGAGMVIYLSALTQKENEITVVANEVTYEFTIYNDKGEEAPVEINITSGVVYNEYYDMLWQVIAADDIYTIGLAGFLNEGGTAAGTYELGDLYTEACGMYYGSSELEITAAHITVVVGEDGSITVDGTLVAGEETYSIHLVYTKPTAETTVELTVAEAELDTEYLEDEEDPEFGVMGEDESGVYVQLYIYNDKVEGDYTKEYLDNEYSAIWLTDDDVVSIYTADIKITREGNVYTVKADLLCYNNTLYKVTMTAEVEDEPTSVDNAAVAAKILKAIENGNVVIKTNNTKFNVGGQVIR